MRACVCPAAVVLSELSVSLINTSTHFLVFNTGVLSARAHARPRTHSLPRSAVGGSSRVVCTPTHFNLLNTHTHTHTEKSCVCVSPLTAASQQQSAVFGLSACFGELLGTCSEVCAVCRHAEPGSVCVKRTRGSVGLCRLNVTIVWTPAAASEEETVS